VVFLGNREGGKVLGGRGARLIWRVNSDVRAISGLENGVVSKEGRVLTRGNNGRRTGEPMLVMTEITPPLRIAIPYGLEVRTCVGFLAQSVVLTRKLRNCVGDAETRNQGLWVQLG
jgi:hypothetical protein